MKISKEKLLYKTTANEPEFFEALELLVDDVNASEIFFLHASTNS